jgi:hypothetical protein
VRGYALLAVTIAGVTSVSADPAITLDWEPSAPALELDPTLGLDPVLRTELEGIGAETIDVLDTRYALGARTHAAIHTTLWSNDRDVAAEGWTVDARVSRDLGWNISLVLDASLARAIGGLERDNGTYASVSVALVRLFHLAHKRVAWISLGIEKSTWFGDASTRLPGGTVVGLHAGFTF